MLVPPAACAALTPPSHFRTSPPRFSPAGQSRGTQPWVNCSYSSGGRVLGHVHGTRTSNTSFVVYESTAENKGFFTTAFGFVAKAQRTITLKPVGGVAVEQHVVFEQSFRRDTTSKVDASELSDCVFTCISHGAGADAGDGYRGR